ncbi:MAG: histidine kinase, partial [Bacteroidetes bacterium]|nr:histidine kinase [Bacteroidota bacterium]
VYGLSTHGQIYVVDERNNINPIPPISALPDEPIKKIKIANDYLFIFTNNELGYVSLKAKNQTYTKAETGFYADEINDVSILGKQLILVTNNGLIVGGMENQFLKKATPLFDILSFKINDKNYGISQTPSVSYKENEVEINYALLGFGVTQNSPLLYSINNEKPRLCSPETRSLKLPALAPGTYSISFLFADSKQPLKTIAFTINKPFWEEAWFTALWLMLLLSVVYIYFKWQIRIIQRRNQLLAEKVELEQNLNTSMLTSIKAQMNPHFFYNALNTIQSFIFSNEKENASAYLNKFSKLTRVILEMSEKESVTLAEEVNAITLYLEIEKARFNDDLNYTITVDNKLESEVMRIPSMIIQPYIENAIKHGLMHKKGEKKLEIKFEIDAENLTISMGGYY